MSDEHIWALRALAQLPPEASQAQRVEASRARPRFTRLLALALIDARRGEEALALYLALVGIERLPIEDEIDLVRALEAPPAHVLGLLSALNLVPPGAAPFDEGKLPWALAVRMSDPRPAKISVDLAAAFNQRADALHRGGAAHIALELRREVVRLLEPLGERGWSSLAEEALGAELSGLGFQREAIRAYQRAFCLRSGRARRRRRDLSLLTCLLGQSVALNRAGFWRRALRISYELIERLDVFEAPSEVRAAALCQWGVALKGEGRWGAAAEAYREAIEAEPGPAPRDPIGCMRFAEPRSLLGEALMQIGELEEALEWHEEAARAYQALEPRAPRSGASRGTAWTLGRWAEALARQARFDEAMLRAREAVELHYTVADLRPRSSEARRAQVSARAPALICDLAAALNRYSWISREAGDPHAHTTGVCSLELRQTAQALLLGLPGDLRFCHR